MPVKRPPSEPPTIVAFFEEVISRSHVSQEGTELSSMSVFSVCIAILSAPERQHPLKAVQLLFTSVACKNALYIGDDERIRLGAT